MSDDEMKQDRNSRMRRSTLAVELQDQGKRLSEVRRGSAFDLVSKGADAITRDQFDKLHDVIAAEMEAEMEAAAVLAKKMAVTKRKIKLVTCAIIFLLAFLATSLVGNFIIMFLVVDSQVKTTTTSDGLLEAKNSDLIVKTAIATEDVPLIVAPALDFDTLAGVKNLKVTYNNGVNDYIETELGIAGVRKHNSTFVEFITSVPGETVETLNGVSSLVRDPTRANGFSSRVKFPICSANATCSAFKASGIDANAALERAEKELEKHGFVSAVEPEECLDAPDVLVAAHSDDTVHSCAEAAERNLCSHPSVKQGCCLTCSGGDPELASRHGRSMASKGGCPPAPTWQTYDYTGSGSGHFATAKVRMHTGHSSRRNVIFLLHGLNNNGDNLYNFVATTLDQAVYENLLFVYPTTSESLYGMNSWNPDVLTEAYGYMAHGVPQLTNFRSHLTSNTNSWPSSTNPSRVDSNSKFAAIGISDGGRLAIFANLYNSLSHIGHGFGIAGHPHTAHTTIPSGGGIPADMDTTGVRVHSYFTSNDAFYDSVAMPNYADAVSSSWTATTSATTVGGWDFSRQEWDDGAQRVIFEVHDGSSTPNFGATGNMFGAPSHTAFITDSGIVDQIIDDALAQFTLDVGSTAGAWVQSWLSGYEDRPKGGWAKAPPAQDSPANIGNSQPSMALHCQNELEGQSNRAAPTSRQKAMRSKTAHFF